MFKFFKKIKKSLLESDITYKIDMIIKNIDKMDIDCLYNIKVNNLVDNKYKEVNIFTINNNMRAIIKKIDTTADGLELELSVMARGVKPLLDYLTVSNKVVAGYRGLIIDSLILYKQLSVMHKELDLSDYIEEHNSKIIDIYIITMDIIIKELYDSLFKD